MNAYRFNNTLKQVRKNIISVNPIIEHYERGLITFDECLNLIANEYKNNELIKLLLSEV